MNNTKAGIAIIALALAFGLGVMFVSAVSDPLPPSSLVAQGTSTFDPSVYGLQSLDAIAGNITSVIVTAIAQTKAWQGYYGNITASITLDDALNFTFYNWTSAEPRGQIYATLNTSIQWATVDCFDFSNTSAAYHLTIENYYNISPDDVDGVNETYTATNHPSFEVVSRTMTGCPTTYIFRDDAAQTADFVNVLLWDGTLNDTGWIYTTLIENKTAVIGNPPDKTCYNGAECDFQILVNEDGHGTDTQTTTYYFWVELI